MFGGGGGLDPRKMQQMMEQMGVDFDELDVADAVIRLEDGTELYFDAPEVNRIVAQGQETYQVVGSPETRERGAGSEESAGSDGDSEGAPDGAETGGEGAIPQDDVDLVATRTGSSEADARAALEATDGDLAAAVDRLE